MMLLLVLGVAVGLSDVAKIPYSFKRRGSVKAVNALLERVLKEDAEKFELKMVDSCNGKTRGSELCFSIEIVDNKVVVSGTSGPDIARGCATYLREACNMSFSWARTGGFQITQLGAKLPAIRGKMVQYRQSDISYYQNVVAASYSHVWWNFNDWEHFLDWASLSGINLALAYTGQEEVARKTFAEFGISDDAFGNWSNGAAWLSWSRGQSMHGVGTTSNFNANLHPDSKNADLTSMPNYPPLSLSWQKKQWELQKQILVRMRELGIVSVLPAFQVCMHV